jgi:hypothetical protein
MASYSQSEHLKTIAWFGETDSEDRSEEYRGVEREAYLRGREIRAASREIAHELQECEGQ